MVKIVYKWITDVIRLKIMDNLNKISTILSQTRDRKFHVCNFIGSNSRDPHCQRK